MSNIINFERTWQNGTKPSGPGQRSVRTHETVTPIRRLSETPAILMQKPVTPVEALERALDEYRATLLELAHRKSEFALQMRMEENTAQIKLEAMAYRALVTGVPESDIYALGEDMAEALSSAMDTVAGA